MKLFVYTVLAATLLTAPEAFARRGADDPAGQQRRCRGCDDGAGHTSIQKQDDGVVIARRGRGADDPAGHVRGEGAGHA